LLEDSGIELLTLYVVAEIIGVSKAERLS